MTAFEIVRAAVLFANIYAVIHLVYMTISFTSYAFRTKTWGVSADGYIWFVLVSALTTASVVMWT